MCIKIGAEYLYSSTSYCIHMSEQQNNLLEKIYEELSNVRHLLEMLLRNQLTQSIESVATTSERRKIYALLDGFSNTEEIAQKANVSQRTVQAIVKDLSDAGLVVAERRGYPKRVFNYIPSEWRINDVSGKE